MCVCVIATYEHHEKWKWKLLSHIWLCNPMDYTVYGILQATILNEVGSLSLLQGIIPTQGSNPALLHCRWILYQLSHKRSPRIIQEWGAYPFSNWSSRRRNRTRVPCIAGRFFTNWAIREAHEYLGYEHHGNHKSKENPITQTHTHALTQRESNPNISSNQMGGKSKRRNK